MSGHELVEHISDDGWTALCGESLVTDEPGPPVCPDCQARASRPPWWRRLADRVCGLPLSRVAWQARRDYFAADRRLARALNVLAGEPDPARRAAVMDGMAEDCWLRHDVYRAAFGPDPNPDEDGRDLADAAGSEALLLAWLAETERVVARTGDREVGDPVTGGPCFVMSGLTFGDEQALDAAGSVLDRLCGTTDPARRADLVDRLYAAVVGTVGGQAAEVLAAGVAPAYRRLAASPDSPR